MIKVINPILRKVLVELDGLDYPLEFWWDDEMLATFELLLTNDEHAVIRAPNTPSSIVEFKLQKLKSYRVSKSTNILLKGECLSFTNASQFYKNSQLSLPTHSFNDDFEFSITLICLLKNKAKPPLFLDYSNYINLDYLKANNLTLEEELFGTSEFNHPNIKPKIIFAEYTTLSQS